MLFSGVDCDSVVEAGVYWNDDGGGDCDGDVDHANLRFDGIRVGLVWYLWNRRISFTVSSGQINHATNRFIRLQS